MPRAGIAMRHRPSFGSGTITLRSLASFFISAGRSEIGARPSIGRL